MTLRFNGLGLHDACWPVNRWVLIENFFVHDVQENLIILGIVIQFMSSINQLRLQGGSNTYLVRWKEGDSDLRDMF
jgi:hypothetical protein